MGGTHEGKTGMIKKINQTRHWVTLEPLGSAGNGYITETFCTRISFRMMVGEAVVQELEVTEQEEEVSEQKEEEVSMLPPPPGYGPGPAASTSSSSSTSSEELQSMRFGDQSMRFGDQLPTRFLLDLLSQSIVMGEEQNNNTMTIEEWQNLVCERILCLKP
jgi:hypothetical protein